MRELSSRWPAATLVLATVLWPAAAGSVDGGGLADAWRFFEGPLLPAKIIRIACPAEKPLRECEAWGRTTKDVCALTGEGKLGRVNGRELSWTRYQRTVSSVEGPFCEMEELVLSRGEPGGKIRPIFYDASNRKKVRIRDPRVVRGRGKDILTLTYCIEPDGACSELDFLWTNDAWQALKRGPGWGQAYKTMPPGFARHPSPPVDFAAMRWEENLLGPGDPACCPSGRVVRELLLTDEAVLEVTSFELKTPPVDVISFARRRMQCDHFRGEDPYNEKRREFLDGRIREACLGTDARLGRLLEKYADDPPVLELLGRYDSNVESDASTTVPPLTSPSATSE